MALTMIKPWKILVPGAGLLLALAGALTFGTVAGRAALAYLRTPDLMALPAMPQVSYQAGSEALAREIAAALPQAIGTVEAAQGLRFAHPVTLRVFADWPSFTRYTGSRPGPAAVTDNDRISFSPVLLTQPQRVRVIVTHELSHALLHQRMGWRALTLPAWFDEGLAVLISDGGTGIPAVGVTTQAALAALLQGPRITPDDGGSLFIHRRGAAFGLSPGMFYRQSELFVRYLQGRDRAGFHRLLAGLAHGEAFAAALRDGYRAPLAGLWQDFLARVAAS